MERSQPLGSLQPFTSLESLTLSETAVGIRFPIINHEEQITSTHLAQSLPQTLVGLTVLVNTDYRAFYETWLGEASALRNLFQTIKHQSPNLSTISIESDSELGASHVVQRSNEAFNLVLEAMPGP